MTIPSIDWWTLAPLIAITCTGIAALFIELLRPKQTNNAIVATSVIGLLVTAWTIVVQFGMPEGSTFGGMILRDQPALLFQLLLVGGCLLTMLFSEGYLRQKRIAFAEFYQLALWSTAGGMIMVSTDNLLMLFLGIEVLSIALYCLAGMSRQEAKSEESALKYFLLGAFASAFLLYGIAFIFGATGSIELSAMRQALEGSLSEANGLAVFGLGLLFIGLAFKAAFVPFHQWTPDVYQGAPTNVTAFMAAGSKIAAVAALWRVLAAALPAQELWMPVLFWVAVLTMTIANFTALIQRDVKRVLGYSSIANAGYVLVGIIAHLSDPEKISLSTTMFYLASYVLMTIGSFAVISLSAKGGEEGTRYSSLNGLWKRAPFAAVCLVIFVASLIGVPPTAGFFGKLFIFNDALSVGLTPLAILLAVNSVVSVYYYLGILKAAFVDDEGVREARIAPLNAGLAFACAICAIGVFALSFAASPFQRIASPTIAPVQAQVYVPPVAGEPASTASVPTPMR